AQATMDCGELVGDDVMIGIVRERLERPDAMNGFVLDGFPRTVAQARALDAIMDGRTPIIVVDIVVPEYELVRRLSTRLICEDCGATAGVADRDPAADKMLAAGARRSPGGTAAVEGQSTPVGCRRCGGGVGEPAPESGGGGGAPA